MPGILTGLAAVITAMGGLIAVLYTTGMLTPKPATDGQDDPTPIPAVTVPSLVTPADGATMDNGRRDKTDAVTWEFGWQAVSGATRYHLFMIGAAAARPVIDNDRITGTSFRYDRPQSYINDRNRVGWTWKVRAQIDGAWADWSSTRTFDVEPVDTD